MIVTSTSEEHLYVVSNAGCWEKDLALMQVQPLYVLGNLSSLFIKQCPGVDKDLENGSLSE